MRLSRHHGTSQRFHSMAAPGAPIPFLKGASVSNARRWRRCWRRWQLVELPFLICSLSKLLANLYKLFDGELMEATVRLDGTSPIHSILAYQNLRIRATKRSYDRARGRKCRHCTSHVLLFHPSWLRLGNSRRPRCVLLVPPHKRNDIAPMVSATSTLSPKFWRQRYPPSANIKRCP